MDQYANESLNDIGFTMISVTGDIYRDFPRGIGTGSYLKIGAYFPGDATVESLPIKMRQGSSGVYPGNALTEFSQRLISLNQVHDRGGCGKRPHFKEVAGARDQSVSP